MNQSPRQRLFDGFEEEPLLAPAGQGGEAAERSERAEPAAPPPAEVEPHSLAGRTVWVVDSHSLIYQVFHAMPDMSGPAGQPIGAVHGFIRDIVDMLEKHTPDFLVCAFDYSDVTFRNAIFEGYKQHREAMPADLRAQFPNIERMLDALGVPRISVPGYEADDILATIARQVREQGGQCVLVTNDKDCRQLIGERVRVYNIRKDEMLDVPGLESDWGIRPEQVIDFQALVGDAVDAVPGVPLIGPKIARELLVKYHTLEGVYEHLDEISGTKRKENLRNFREQALMSRQLVKLHDEVPCQLSWSEARVGRFDAEQLEALCQELGFRRLGERLLEMADAVAPAQNVAATYITVDTPEKLAELSARLVGQTQLVIDLETTSVQPRWADIVGYALAFREGTGWYIPVRGPAGARVLDADLVRETLRPFLESPTIAKLGQNLKYDLIVLRCQGIRLAGVAFDTMVADYLLAPGERNHDLDDLAWRYLKHETIKIASLIGAGKNQKRMDEVPIAEVTEYAGEDAELPLRLAKILRRRLKTAELTSLFSDLEMPLLEVLAELEFNGIRIDAQVLERMSEQFGERLRVLQDEIHELAGQPFNIDSPKQLAEILFQRLRLPVLKRTRKTGPSTDVDVLEGLAPLHPLPAKMVEYRQISKLKGTYLDALPKLVHPVTGRVHTSFKQDVAATGRLSSKDPNLQNIPVRTEEGRVIRSAFLPAPGWQLMTADYSQIELRVLAHFSGDPALLDAFARDEDIHARVASEVFDVPVAEVTSEMRRRAKAVNFGIIYGQSAFGLAKGLGISKEEAAAFIAAYFARYPGVHEFMEMTLDTCREKGYVSTILGRRRTVEGVRSPAQRGDGRSRTLPERIAINTVIQGSAADIIKQAMLDVHRRLADERLQARLLLQIHDELVLEFPADELTRLTRLVETAMTGAARLNTPLKVDIQCGANWAACDDVPR